MALPHPDTQPRSLLCAVLTISDTRTPDSDRSGQLIHERLATAGHRVGAYHILKDEPDLIRMTLTQLPPTIEVILLNGGTGIAPRDTTYDAIAALLDKSLPGFGELFRMLSYEEVQSRAMASRAIAGTWGDRIIFSMPGSSNAVKLAMDQLILPEIVHLVQQLRLGSNH